MIMPRQETCSKCGEDYQAGCLVQIPPICDKCNGYPGDADSNKINTTDEYLKAIHEITNKRYGSSKSKDKT